MAYDGWWSTLRMPWWHDYDAFDHLTATCYPVIYQDAFADFVARAWTTSAPAYVLAQTSVHYLREIRRQETPLHVFVGISHVGRSSFTVSMAISAEEQVCSTSESRYSAWDVLARGSRALTPSERDGLARYLIPPEGKTGDVVS